MSEQDDRASKLEEGEVVCSMVFPAAHQSSEVMQPDKESFDLPAANRYLRRGCYAGGNKKHSERSSPPPGPNPEPALAAPLRSPRLFAKPENADA